MNTTAHLLSTRANRKRLFESIAQDKRTSKGASKAPKGKQVDKNVKYWQDNRNSIDYPVKPYNFHLLKPLLFFRCFSVNSRSTISGSLPVLRLFPRLWASSSVLSEMIRQWPDRLFGILRTELIAPSTVRSVFRLASAIAALISWAVNDGWSVNEKLRVGCFVR